MNARFIADRTRSLALVGSLGALFLVPTAALADPPAVGVPTIPPVFIGAPTNDNPNAGQFAVSFDSTGQYLGIGSAPEPPLTRDLAPAAPHAYRQARVAVESKSTSAGVDRVFDRFKEQLRDNAAPQAAVR